MSERECISSVIKKDDQILRTVTDLTEKGDIWWVARTGSLYVAEFKNYTFEFYPYANRLTICGLPLFFDSREIDATPFGESRDLSLFKSLEREIRKQPVIKPKTLEGRLQQLLEELKA
jgi:hypothetical protein